MTAQQQPPQVAIHYVDTNTTRQVVDAVVTDPTGQSHRIGHLPVSGWYCSCPRAKRCPYITHVQRLIPRIPPRH